jgi:hypothetical protein
MPDQSGSRWDLFLLCSFVVVILVFPSLDHGDARRWILSVLLFLPVVLATVRTSRLSGWAWPRLILASAVIALTIVSGAFPVKGLEVAKWSTLALFFGTCIAGLFRYLKQARTIDAGRLYTAATIYLLIGATWFALYCAIDVLRPGAFWQTTPLGDDRRAELLYFSLVTLSTIGYGDVVPLQGEARMLAALEGITGVLYVAILVAVLVNGYKARGDAT